MLTRFLVLTGVCAALTTQAQTVEYSTPQPRVEDVNDRDVIISRVDLTAQYTIVYMRFREASRNKLGSTIQFIPTARLYANDGARSFKFIRAENIPTARRMDVNVGQTIDFVTYFERLDPGIEKFDLFECSNRNRPGEVCFNFWGVRVINPSKKTRQPQATPPPRPRPTPAPTPKPTPRTDPDAIYTTPVPPTPAPALAIKGLVRDAKTGKPVATKLTFRLLSGAESSGNEPADSVRASAADGAYTIAGEALTVWDIAVSAKGYFGQRDTVSMGRGGKTLNFDLVPIVAGTKITLKNIYFAQSKYELQAESFSELNQLTTVMRQNPTMTIRLEGHTDIIGDFDANLELSRNRVFAVKRYLIGKGIADARVEAVGYGHSRPINSTRGTPHPENRRVELVITKA